MNAMQQSSEKREARSENAADLLLLSQRIRETERFLGHLRLKRNALLDQLDAALPRRLDPAAQERVLEDALSAPGPLADKLATGMRIVHSPPSPLEGEVSGCLDDRPRAGRGEGESFEPDEDFSAHAAREAKEMAAEQARRIACQDSDGNWILDCLECGNEFKTAQRCAMCPDCTDRFTDSNGQA